MKPLPLSFFNRPTLTVAEELIGCYLCIKRDGKTVRCMISETEAYDGFEDMASHAHRGKTPRNQIMFRKAGHIYVYFTYGMHWMLNIVTGEADYPAAVLIRGVEGFNGPAKLTKALGITCDLNGKIVGIKTGLWIEPRQIFSARMRINKSPRVGVAYSGPIWSKKNYRFTLE